MPADPIGSFLEALGIDPVAAIGALVVTSIIAAALFVLFPGPEPRR
jgi:hypothetical protein